MGVIVPRAKMPNNCEECDFKALCEDYWKNIREAYTRPSWCSLDDIDTMYFCGVPMEEAVEVMRMYKNGELVHLADRKTEPQTPYDNCQSCLHWVYDGYWYCECNECHYEPKDEPQTVETMSCQECKHWDNGCTADYFCKYEPKDEPQTETEIARAIVHRIIDDAVIAEDAYPDLRQKMHDAVDEYEPQTDN